MFIIDILIYLCLATVLFLFARKSYINYRNDNNIDIYLWMFLFLFAIIAGIRWNVGADSISYAQSFATGKFNKEKIEPLWLIFTLFIKDMNIHWSIGMGLAAFLQMLFILKRLENYKFVILLLPFVLFGGKYWIDLMNGVRQMLVACMFFWASKFIVKKEFLKYLLFILISIQIHTSAIILLPLYFVPNSFSIYKKRTLLTIVFLCCFFIGLSPDLQFLSSYVQYFTNNLGYESYTTRVGDFLLNDYDEETRAFGPMMFSYFLVALFIIWFGPELMKTYSKHIPELNKWLNYSFFHSCLFFLFCNVSHIFLRPVMFLVIFQMVVASLLLYHLLCKKDYKSKYKISYILFCLVIFTNQAWSMYKSNKITDTFQGERWETATYKVFFLHEDQVNKLGL